MAKFVLGVPVETVESLISVEISQEEPLGVGRHLFRLTVTDDSGNVSDPSELVVFILDASRPNAILTGPTRVPFQQSFELDGSRSTDIGGKIVSYTWTLVD